MSGYYIQDTELGMVPFENQILKPSFDRGITYTKLCISFGDNLIAGPIYIFQNNEKDEVISREFITELEIAIIEEVESEGTLTQEKLQKMLSQKIINRFNGEGTPQKEKDAILSAVNDGGFFKEVISQLKNVPEVLKEEE